jgi:alpha-methylacyl-CoA racemase
MVLAGLGADVIRVDRPVPSPIPDPTNRGRRSIVVDLSRPEGAEVVLALVGRADGLMEGFRPGVAERLGVGPEPCLRVNPRLVYGRITGWGQEGPWAQRAGHDIDYLAVTGVLHAIGPPETPVIPLNLVADYGGGGMLLALGMVSALFHAASSGQGQVVDCAMVDGVALLSTVFHLGIASGWWQDRRGVNLLDGGAPFYSVYETSDNRHMAVGALEPEFFARLLEAVGEAGREQMEVANWPAMRQRFAEIFKLKTQAEWTAAFSDVDACVAPVLSLGEAPSHPQLAARRTFVDVGGVRQPAPAPRFSATPAALPTGLTPAGRHTDEILAELDFSAGQIGKLRAGGVVK